MRIKKCLYGMVAVFMFISVSAFSVNAEEDDLQDNQEEIAEVHDEAAISENPEDEAVNQGKDNSGDDAEEQSVNMPKGLTANQEDTASDEDASMAIATLDSYTGFRQDNNGDWYYYKNGSKDTSTTDVIQGIVNGKSGWWNVVKGKVTKGETVAHNSNGWWYINSNGMVDFSYNGFAHNSNGWWYLESGKVTFNKNSVIQGTVDGTNAWWYVTGSKVQTDFTGLADYSNSNGWWYINKGKVTFDANTVAQNKNGWWYVEDSKVIFNYNGFAQNSNGWWYIENGTVTFNKNSVIQDTKKKVDGTDGWWYVVGSKVQKSYTGVANYSNSNGWWYITNGKVDFTANTIANNNNGWWYVKDGKVIFSYNGFGSNSNGKWYVESGKVTFNKNSVIQDTTGAIGTKGTWWYVVGSQVQTGFTGLANYSNSNGWWYIKNGQVDFTHTGVDQNKNGWWFVDNGKVDFSFTGYAQNSNGWWYIKNGQVDFSVSVSVSTSMANAVLTLINQERAKYGLSSLSMPSIHQTMAMQRAFELTVNFSHYRPNGSLCNTVLSDYGVTTNIVGENIAYGQTTAASVVNAWMNSEGHRDNILNSSYTNVGIACVKVNGVYYWEQLFTGSYSQK